MGPYVHLVRESVAKVKAELGDPSEALPSGANPDLLLPLIHGDTRLFALNVTTITDALDEGQSVIARAPSGQIMAIQRPVFREEQLRGRCVFKIPQQVFGRAFVTEEFVQCVEAARLKEFEFPEVWASASSSPG